MVVTVAVVAVVVAVLLVVVEVAVVVVRRQGSAEDKGLSSKPRNHWYALVFSSASDKLLQGSE